MSTQKRLVLFTALTSLTISIASPSLSETWQPYPRSHFYALSSYSDREILDLLVSKYRSDPTSFEAAYEYLSLNRPYLLQTYLNRTQNVPKPVNYGHSGGFGALAAGVAGAAGIGLALAGSASSRSSSDSSNSPDIVGPERPSDPQDPRFTGDTESFRTFEYKTNSGLDMINAADRYTQGGQGQGVKIAVLDTGIYADNSEFAGKIDMENSHSYFGDASDITDTGGHGTHVSGILAAGKDDFGVHGVAFDSELVIFKGIPGDETEASDVSSIWADAINRSITSGASVMNNSWTFIDESGEDPTSLLITEFETRTELRNYLGTQTLNALDNAVQNDLMIVAAAGNDGQDAVAVNAGIPLLYSEYGQNFISTVSVDNWTCHGIVPLL